MTDTSSSTSQCWLIVGSEDNYNISKGLGFTVQGIKSRHRNKAKLVQPGDKMVYYLTGLQVLAGIVTVMSPFYEDDTPVWGCNSKRPEERYPFRFKIAPDLILEKPQYLPVQDIHQQLTYLKKWPEPHWRLGFQGNIHLWPEQDYAFVRQQMMARHPLAEV